VRQLGASRRQVVGGDVAVQVDEELERRERQGLGGVDERDSGVVPAYAVEAGALAGVGALGVTDGGQPLDEPRRPGLRRQL